MKKRYVIVACFVLCVLLAACILSIPLTDARDAPWGDPPYNSNGEVSGAAQGFGSEITVYITLVDGFITTFRFEGGYTHGYVTIVNNLRQGWADTILSSNSFDFPVDVGSGATVTFRGVRAAGRNALIGSFGSITEADFTLND